MSEFPSADEEAALAASALDEGDIGSAKHHLTGALSVQPLNPQWLALAQRLFSLVGDPVALTGLSDRPWFGEVAFHALALAFDGRHTEAIHLLLQVGTVRPEVPYLRWASAWLDESIVAVDPDELVPALLRFVEVFHGKGALTAVQKDQLSEVIPVLQRLNAAYTDHLMLRWLLSVTYRHVGRIDEAIAEAEAGFESRGQWLLAVAAANAWRQKGELKTAETWFRKARAANPEHLPILLDLGDLLCEQGDAPAGLACYEEALVREPEHPWAWPSSLYFRWRIHGDDSCWYALDVYADAHPDNPRAQTLREVGSRLRSES